jgi:hypothetical protein
MKTMKIAILIISSYFLFSDQSKNISTWERRYGTAERAEFAWDIVETDEGSFVVCGIKSCKNLFDINGWVIKIDREGEIIWTKELGGKWQDFITCVILNKDKELVFTGTKSQSPFDKQVWFLILDKEGNLLKEKTFGGKSEDSGHRIIQNKDGSYMILGDTKSFGSQKGGKDVLLLKLNSNGEVLWRKTYDFGGQDMGTDIIPFQNNKYLITAVSCTANCGGMFQQGFSTYIVIDAEGNILKTKTFKEGKKNKFIRVAPTLDGGAILVGATSKKERFPSEDIWVVKLNKEAEIEWERTFGSYGRYDGGLDIFQSPDSGYYLCAYSQSLQTKQMDYDNWWLLKLDSKGNFLWSKWWGGPLNDDPYAIIPTSDDGLIIAGWKDANSNPFYKLSLGNADFYVIKTNSNGEINGK